MLLAERLFQVYVSKLILAEKNKVAVCTLQPQKIGEPIRSNAHPTGSIEEDQVDPLQRSRGIQESLSDLNLVLRPVATTTV